jgi:ubiquinone biosynthesis protein
MARAGAEVFLEMIFRDGFFHADPHPGNFLVLTDHRIGLLDCGMVGRIDERTREALEDLLVAFVMKDVDGIVDVILRICEVPRGFDRRAFTADVDLFIADYLSGSLAEIDLSGMLQELIAIIHTYHIIAPANIIMLGKMLALLEGTGRLLDPDFDLWELAQPYYRQVIERRYAPDKLLRVATRTYRDWRRLLMNFPREMASLLRDISQGELQVRLQVGGLDQVVNRVVYGVVTAAIILASSLLWSSNVPPRLFDVSIVGVLGVVFGIALSLRLLFAIHRSGGL